MMLPFRPYEGSEPYIFADFSYKDMAVVLPLLQAMNESGYRLWYDGGMIPGMDWMDTMAEHIQKCTVGLVFLSQNTADSRTFKAEVWQLIRSNKSVISIVIEAGIELPHSLEMVLSPYHSFNLYQNEPPSRLIKELEKMPSVLSCQKKREEAG